VDSVRLATTSGRRVGASDMAPSKCRLARAGSSRSHEAAAQACAGASRCQSQSVLLRPTLGVRPDAGDAVARERCADQEPKTFTARAMTRITTAYEIKDSAAIRPLARRVNGIVSVGLTAIALVSDT